VIFLERFANATDIKNALVVEKPEGGLSQYQVSVRREAVHIRASRFKLTKMVQIFLRFEAEREASHEAGVRACSAKTVAPNEIQLNGVGGLRTQLHAHRRSHDRTEKAK
jgi:hypothetical protein